MLPMAFYGLHLFHLQTQLDSLSPTATPSWMNPKVALAISTDPDGKTIYISRCVSCHQMNGQGLPGVFPPLDGTEWVQGDKGRIIRIVLHGMMGETTVAGTVYDGAMPPWNTVLDDAQVAAVLTFIRRSWSNDASTVSSSEVALVRAVTKDRIKPWTEAELEQSANLGIPGQRTPVSLPDSTGF
jgi:mono/diheme cytochrome c family protein